MIRIDEIYNNTFWPWIQRNCSGMRMFFCDPPGATGIDALFNFGRDDIEERDYVFFHDQEPVDARLYQPLFDEVLMRMNDVVHKLNDPTFKYSTPFEYFKANMAKYEDYFDHVKSGKFQAPQGHVIVSEHGEYVEKLASIYGWRTHYYFYHGWAALDWYRGYDRTYLMPKPSQRKITKTFIAPNRIVAGERQHRLLMLYHIFKNRLTNNWISCPDVCPAENIPVVQAAEKLKHIYPDIVDVFAQQSLPMSFPNESGAPMHSCWLSLFDESAESLLYLVTETIANGRRLQLTEKTFKPICLRMPFVIVGTQHSLKYLRSYGFRTFEGIWDESYDDEPNDTVRIERIASLLRSLDELPAEAKQDLFEQAQEVIEHNYQHFYGGAFESLLWEELQGMLNGLKSSR
jgi:hypothetical protein